MWASNFNSHTLPLSLEMPLWATEWLVRILNGYLWSRPATRIAWRKPARSCVGTSRRTHVSLNSTLELDWSCGSTISLSLLLWNLRQWSSYAIVTGIFRWAILRKLSRFRLYALLDREKKEYVLCTLSFIAKRVTRFSNISTLHPFSTHTLVHYPPNMQHYHFSTRPTLLHPLEKIHLPPIHRNRFRPRPPEYGRLIDKHSTVVVGALLIIDDNCRGFYFIDPSRIAALLPLIISVQLYITVSSLSIILVQVLPLPSIISFQS